MEDELLDEDILEKKTDKVTGWYCGTMSQYLAHYMIKMINLLDVTGKMTKSNKYNNYDKKNKIFAYK